MSLPVDSHCLQCYLRRHIELVRPLGDEKKTTAFARKVMELILSMPEDTPSPCFGPYVTDLLHEMYGLDLDRYREEKKASNAFVLQHMDAIRAKVEAAADPVFTGLQFAIQGNYLDFSALQGNVSFDTLETQLDEAENMVLDREVYQNLCRDMENGRTLLYLTDNAGEIGFDRIFAEQIHRKYPNLEITFCVRGANASNDATREDAAAVGIPFRIIDNGNRIAATYIDQLGDEARQELENADVILSKGMGNAETLYGCGYNVYYAFLVKCAKFMTLFDKPMFTPMLVRDSGRHD